VIGCGSDLVGGMELLIGRRILLLVARMQGMVVRRSRIFGACCL